MHRALLLRSSLFFEVFFREKTETSSIVLCGIYPHNVIILRLVSISSMV